MMYGHDIEVYPNFFCTTIENYNTGEKEILEISEWQDDLDKIVWTYNTALHNAELVSFNGIHYDSPVIKFIIVQYDSLKQLPVHEICAEIDKFSQYIIRTDMWWRQQNLKKYKYNHPWIDIDVYLHWSRMLRLSKKISLKSLGIQLGYPIVQELPYPPGMHLSRSQAEEVKHYNYEHDMGIMRKILFDTIRWQGKPTTVAEQIELRRNIQRTYNLDCLSWDAPKIASEIMLDEYCKQTGADKYETRKSTYNSNECLELHNPEFKLHIFKTLYTSMQCAGREFHTELNFIHRNTAIKLSYGVGGIHSVNNNEIYTSDKHNIVYTSDVGSLYPNLIINYGLIRQSEVLNSYIRIKDERMEAKRTGDGAKNVTLKLVLNSLSGLLDSPYSWLYYPEGAMKMRLQGQLVLTKTLEDLAIAGFQVVSLNTDGLECIVPVDREQEYLSIVDNVGKTFNLEFEHEQYSKICYANVNNYIAIKPNGKYKTKGSSFIENPNLGDSCNMLIVPKAIVNYFRTGQSVDSYIKGDHHIFNYCLSKKVDKSFKVVYGDEVLPQRLNRYYVSKKGKYLYKLKNNKKTHMLKGYGVKLYNTHTDEAISDIDYSFYIHQANSIIQTIERNNQLTIF